MSRRNCLAAVMMGGLGLASTVRPIKIVGATPASAPSGFGKAKSVIVVFTGGGQSQIDMWDPKPLAPDDVRSVFHPIATKIPGVQFTEHMPKVASIADRLTVVRTMSHEDLDHGTAFYLAMTGRYHTLRSANPPPKPDDFPTMGAVVRRVMTKNHFVYNAVHLNGPAIVPTTLAPGQDGGLLGRGFEPLVVGDVRSSDEVIPGLLPQMDLPTSRMSTRLNLKETLDTNLRNMRDNRTLLDANRLYRQAFEMLSSNATRDAFDLEAESPALRDRYGRHRSGQACLLARRLVEAGVPYVNVIWNHSNRGQDFAPEETDAYGWDTHNDIFDALRDRLIPRFDESFSALIEDLDQRGLLDTTLVVCMGEFGRAPRVAREPRFKGDSPGRKHWASVYSIALAGAGVKRGVVIGASDRMGGEPVTDRFGPWDVTATIYNALGIAADDHYPDAIGRKFPISIGRPIEELY